MRHQNALLRSVSANGCVIRSSRRHGCWKKSRAVTIRAAAAVAGVRSGTCGRSKRRRPFSARDVREAQTQVACPAPTGWDALLVVRLLACRHVDTVSVVARLLVDAIDHQHGHWTLAQLQLQTQLALHGVEQRQRAVRIGGAQRAARRRG